MKKTRIDTEVCVREIAEICGVTRQMAGRWVQAGEIAGSRLVAGKLWVAPRSKVLAHARRRRRLAEAARPKVVAKVGFALVVEGVNESLKRLGRDINASIGPITIAAKRPVRT
jgi:hypothetical protein